jgi:hypothetical protein
VIDGIRSRCLAAVSKRQKKPGAIARRDFEERKKSLNFRITLPVTHMLLLPSTSSKFGPAIPHPKNRRLYLGLECIY